MRYGYDMNNPIEREMYIEKHKRELQRAADNTKTPQEKYNEFIKEQQAEFEYFRKRDLRERAEAAEAEKQIQEQIEEKLPQMIDKVLDNLLKDFK